jgi:hypothetical protein
MGFRRNDGSFCRIRDRHDTGPLRGPTAKPHALHVDLYSRRDETIVDPSAASALRKSVGPGVAAGPNGENVPARRPAPANSEKCF